LERDAVISTDEHARVMLQRLMPMCLKLAMCSAAGRIETLNQHTLLVTKADATAALTVAEPWSAYARAFAAQLGQTDFERDEDKLALDTQRLEIHLTSLQAEVEAKVRRVHRFRQQMHQLDGRGSGKMNAAQRERAVRALITQVDQMLETNIVVRGLLQDLRSAAHAVLDDLAGG
jgi:hypothetical protein